MRARADEKIVVFVGPTLSASPRARALLRPMQRLPPVRRFDVTKVLESARRPGIMVIVDGVFHDTLAVGHAEIRDALKAGWKVWGLSSMGAIRAREMAPLGMRGFGRVYERFVREDDFQDDEVALLHEPTPPYRAVTEPLIHLRTAIDHLVATKVVEAVDARRVVAELKSRWYGERTIRGTEEALAPLARGGSAAVRAALGDFRQFAIKTTDLEDFLEQRPWAQSS